MSLPVITVSGVDDLSRSGFVTAHLGIFTQVRPKNDLVIARIERKVHALELFEMRLFQAFAEQVIAGSVVDIRIHRGDMLRENVLADQTEIELHIALRRTNAVILFKAPRHRNRRQQQQDRS